MLTELSVLHRVLLTVVSILMQAVSILSGLPTVMAELIPKVSKYKIMKKGW